MTRRFPTLVLSTIAVLALIPWLGVREDAAAVPADPRQRPPLTAPGVRIPPSDTLRFDGEYGLWVQEVGENLEIRWITRDDGPGSLEARVGDRTVHATTTAGGASHLAILPRPNSNTVVLHYGTVGDPADHHQTTLDLGTRQRAGTSFSDVDSVFVVGDVHGEFDTLVRLLRNTGVIGKDLRWRAGRSHLVMLGDFFSRGSDVTRLLWFLYDLERQAEQADGRMHVVLGNHEIMTILDDLRYVAPKESLIAQRHGVSYSRMFDVRKSVLGRWLATKPAILRINDVLYAHGGVAENQLRYSLQTYDDSLATFMSEDLFYFWADTTTVLEVTEEQVVSRDDFFWGPNSAFWFRGYVQSDTFGDGLARVLRHFRANLHVVAHTPVPTVTERYQGSIVAVNTIPPAAELLLLVREPGGATLRFRWGTEGRPQPLSSRVTSLSPRGEPLTVPGRFRSSSASRGRERAVRSSP